ncbi:MAG: arylsulfatase [Verrucomicrobiota bacterium]|nr:arylsulfatase [Verrucomicrobiota bacterium]
MKSLTALSALSLLLAFSLISAAEKPNVIFVLFDDMGYGEPTSYRPDSLFKTPNIDRMAKEGMRFTDGHASAASCTPSRYGFITGRYPHRIGQYGVLSTFSPPLIPESRLTIASFLKNNGYNTACIGKWHLGMEWGKPKQKGKNKVKHELKIGDKMTGGPNAIGFDYFYGFTHARNIQTIIEQDTVFQHVEPVENQPIMIAKAVEYLKERAEKPDEPFFLYFPMCPPHSPVVPAPEYIGKGGDASKGNYADWVHQGDAMLGEILDTLAATGLAENTLVIASADNGAAGKEYAPLREHKASIYEGGHREPFLAVWPGKIEAGSTCDQTVSITDIFATCADIVGVPLPDNAGEDSVSFLKCLNGEQEGPFREASVQQSGRKAFAIRQGQWKLIIHGDNHRELFDLANDIGETTNVIQEHPELANTMATLLQSYLDKGRSTPGEPQPIEHMINLDEVRYNKTKK